MSANRALVGRLALATIALAAAGEALVPTHTADVLGLILLACGAAAALAVRAALCGPRTRADIRV